DAAVDGPHRQGGRVDERERPTVEGGAGQVRHRVAGVGKVDAQVRRGDQVRDGDRGAAVLIDLASSITGAGQQFQRVPAGRRGDGRGHGDAVDGAGLVADA